MTKAARWDWHQPRRLIAVLVCGLLMAGVANAQRDDWESDWEDADEQIQSETGFVFVNGEYLPAPYEIAIEDSVVRINGKEFGEDAFGLSGYDRTPRASGPTAEGSRTRGEYDGRRAARALRFRNVSARSPLKSFGSHFYALRQGGIVVLSPGRPPLGLRASNSGHELLKALIAKGSDGPVAAEIPEAIEVDTDRETWRHLVANFQPTPDFLRRATEQVRRVQETGDRNESLSVAHVWSDRIAFPLTVFAIVLVVFAAGHLMTYAPQTVASGNDPQVIANAKMVTVRSLAIVAALSVIDLVWTLIAHQSGSMRELNPLGSHLIDDPVHLTAFKIGITSTSIGLLYWLHELPLARRAAWYCCLVLTLLTARWLTFNSMFL